VAYGDHLYLECAVCDVTISRHIPVSKSTFWQNMLTHYAYSSTRTLLILCVIALNINYQRSKGVKHTHHYVRAIYNCKTRLRECLVKYEQSSIGVRLDWLAHTRVCKIESCQTTQELKMRKSTQENFRFLVFYRSPGFLFSLLKHYQIPEWLYANNCCF